MSDFSGRILNWWQQHGRHDLPWQTTRTAYRVWVAEIMLQQTRVTTAIPYFQRFIARFPELETLAAASQDDVLALWSGLGYYARARNLHRAAGICVAQHAGQLPDRIDALQALPGIGRSTAAAILAQAHNQRHAILDGNAKRLFARHAGIAGWPGRSTIAAALWAASEFRLPASGTQGRYADYTQAVMDLGATLCTRSRPNCPACPVRADCNARHTGRTAELPTPRPHRALPQRETTLLVMHDQRRRMYFVRRPPAGVWGGLWCLPEIHHAAHTPDTDRLLGTIDHRFTHFHLKIAFRQAKPGAGIVAVQNGRWLTTDQALRLGLPRPLRTFLETST